MLRLRCSFEKVSSEERFCLTISPSSKVTGLSFISMNLTSKTLAIVDLPDPENPVKKTVKPCFDLGGNDFWSSATTSGYENHSGISSPFKSLC